MNYPPYLHRVPRLYQKKEDRRRIVKKRENLNEKERTGVNFINILSAVFMSVDIKCAKKTDGLTVFFAILESSRVKTLRKMLVKLTPGGQRPAKESETMFTKWIQIAGQGFSRTPSSYLSHTFFLSLVLKCIPWGVYNFDIFTIASGQPEPFQRKKFKFKKNGNVLKKKKF